MQNSYQKLDFSIKEILFADQRSLPTTRLVKHTKRKHFSLIFSISGSAEYNFGKCKETICESEIVFINKGDSYTARSVGKAPWEYIIITFDMWEDDPSLPFKFVTKPSHPKQFEELFEKIYTTFKTRENGAVLKIKGLMYEIFSLLLDQSDTLQNVKYKGVKKAIDYINSHYKEKISVEKIADISGYSTSHFTRLFGELFCMTPVEYINSVRIEMAKNMLKTELFTLTEIAEECGFSNVYYFSKVFKKVVGIPPKKY